MTFAELREIYNLFDIAQEYGVKLKGNGRCKWGVCPLPNHSHKNFSPSFSIYWWKDKQMFKCHGNCGAVGDVIDFYGYMHVAGYNRSNLEHKKRAAGFLRGNKISTLPPIPPKKPQLKQWIWKKFLPIGSNAKKYAIARGLTKVQIAKFKLGSASFVKDGKPIKKGRERLLAIPTFHKNELMGIKFRILDKKAYRYFSYTGSKKGLFNYNDVYLSENVVFLVKGEIAAMVMDRFGYLACAPTGGEGGSVEDSTITALAFAKVIVVGDNDKDPKVDKRMKRYAERRAKLLNGTLKFPPKHIHDIDEWLLSKPKQACNQINKWIETLTKGGA